MKAGAAWLRLRASLFALSLSLSLVLLTSAGFTALRVVWPALGKHLFGAALLETLLYGTAALLLLRLARPERGLLALPGAPWRVLLCAGLAGVALHGPLDYIEAWVEHFAPLSDAVLAERAARLVPDAAWERVALLVAVAVLVPLVEEWFFRGGLFEFLNQAREQPLRAWPSTPQAPDPRWAFPVALSSVCFAVSHGEPRNWPALILVALVLGALRAASGSLYPSILLHAAFNATTLLVSYSTPSALTLRPTPWLPGALIGGALSTALILLAIRPYRAAQAGRAALTAASLERRG